MQIMPETAIWLGKQNSQPILIDDLFDPKTNIGLGAYCLNYLRDRFPTPYAVLAAWRGPTNARRWLDEHIWDGSYERTGHSLWETRSYVRKVIMMQNLYRLCTTKNSVLEHENNLNGKASGNRARSGGVQGGNPELFQPVMKRLPGGDNRHILVKTKEILKGLAMEDPPLWRNLRSSPRYLRRVSEAKFYWRIPT